MKVLALFGNQVQHRAKEDGEVSAKVFVLTSCKGGREEQECLLWPSLPKMLHFLLLIWRL